MTEGVYYYLGVLAAAAAGGKGDRMQNTEGKCGISPTDERSNRRDDDEAEERGCADAVREWTMKIPIGMGFCPWASKSHCRGLIRIVECHEIRPMDVTGFMLREIESLISPRDDSHPPPPLSTTLVACPHVREWYDFLPFEEFVSSGMRNQLEDENASSMMERVALVAFHPDFIRWRGLPDGMCVGGEIRSHYATITGHMSEDVVEATIIETENGIFGRRKVRVRLRDELLDGIARREQYVPIEWLVFPDGTSQRPPLPDNAMHRAPYPTIHVIAKSDMESICVRGVSRVKRLNAQRIARLGWEGFGIHGDVNDAPNLDD